MYILTKLLHLFPIKQYIKECPSLKDVQKE